MKRFFRLLSLVFFSIASFAQNNGTLEFLGIPIDGPIEQMYDALGEKGFEKVWYSDYMTGVFNGENVHVYFSTNHGIVDKVRVEYPYYSEENEVRVKYNVLLSRFNRNAKYICVIPHAEVSSDENIRGEVSLNSKSYEAIYFYLNPGLDGKAWVEGFKQEYLRRYKKPLEGLSYEEMEEALFCLPAEVSDAVIGVVWFTIVNANWININYVNFRNRPRGEDL